jgi:Fe-S cluster biogenesis protein NfuA/nitrite reductase/ring-hydroxylating ferredoxin subunit
MAQNGAVEAARDGLDPDHLIGRVQELTARLEAVDDPVARELAEELVAAVVQMYGGGLERILEVVAGAGPAGQPIQEAMAADGLVASLMLIHDLYPISLEERVAEALERVRPYMESHGGNVELLGVEDRIAYLRLEGSCKTCAASSATLELAVRQALEEAAPDLEGMEVEGVAEPEPTGLALPIIGNGGAPGGALELPLAQVPAPAPPAWFEVDGAFGLAPGAMTAVHVAGARLVIANVEGTLLAYRSACASCGGALDGGALQEGALTCPGCGRSYFLPRAGRSLDDERLQLDPVPLLLEQGGVKVALAV